MSRLLLLGKLLKKRATLASLLAKFGTNAHAWLPGASGVSVSGLPTSNYLLSDGSTGYSTVDGVDGLTLDGVGTVVPIATYDFSSATGWFASGGASIGGGVVSCTASTGYLYRQGLPTPLDKTFKITFTISGYSGGTVRVYVNSAPVFSGTFNSNGTKTVYLIAATTSGELGLNFPTAFTGTIDDLVLEQVTGAHLTQPTTANKPLVRRGMFNELLNSATPATQSVTCIAAPYTLALYGTGNVVLSGTGAGTLTGTGASDLVVLNFTPTAGSVTFTKAGTVSSFGLFKGTFTAAQILAEGGIPTTTAIAASNPTSGKYWWSFDGSNDSFLTGNLGITDTVTVVIAGVLNTLPAVSLLVCEDANGARLGVSSTGAVSFDKNGVAALVATAAGVIVAGVPFVLTARLQAGNADIRKAGAQIATAASALTFSATAGMRIGTKFDGVTYPCNGSIFAVQVITATTTDAECLSIERLVAQQAGITI